MNIETKYKIDDMVYFIQLETYRNSITCPCCLGIGRIRDTDTYSCHYCHGKGTISGKIESRYLISDIMTVTNIILEYDGKEWTEGYKIKSNNRSFYWEENEIYPTRKEAEKECNKRNKKLKEQREG